MKYWHINSHTIGNRNHMIRRNYCYIGLGNDINDYNQRILKNKNTTPHQFYRFQVEAEPGDIILLYQNKKGYGSVYLLIRNDHLNFTYYENTCVFYFRCTSKT